MITKEGLLRSILLFIGVFISSQSCIYAEPVAFPGAEGFGRMAVGGRGGTVYHVTNLDDAGPGSFRDAVSEPNRTVVFDIGGLIHIKERIVVAGNITIAGQSAPGDGIVIYGNGLSFSGADNAIVRYMRFRMGAGGDKGKDAVTIAKGSPMIFDHVSVSWGRDENFSISGDDGFFTIQDSIIAQGLHSHSCGGLLQNWGGISVLRTLYIDNHTRNPKVKGVNQFVNNVVYNWRAAGYILGDSSGQSQANVMQNYYIAGPQTPSGSPFTRGNENFHIYAEKNYYDMNKNGILDGEQVSRADYGIVTWRTELHDFPELAVVYNPQTAYKQIVSRVGACLPVRDPVDTLLISQLASVGINGEIIANENQLSTGGPGKIEGAAPATDTDRDGMPDYWEHAIEGLDPETKDNNGDLDNNGYTNLEEYLNWLAVPHAKVSKNSPLRIDLRRFTGGFDESANFKLSTSSRGSVELLSDGHTVRFSPPDDEVGLAYFDFTVDDGDRMDVRIYLLITKT
jgi:pectate lyase